MQRDRKIQIINLEEPERMSIEQQQIHEKETHENSGEKVDFQVHQSNHKMTQNEDHKSECQMQQEQIKKSEERDFSKNQNSSFEKNIQNQNNAFVQSKIIEDICTSVVQKSQNENQSMQKPIELIPMELQSTNKISQGVTCDQQKNRQELREQQKPKKIVEEYNNTEILQLFQPQQPKQPPKILRQEQNIKEVAQTALTGQGQQQKQSTKQCQPLMIKEQGEPIILQAVIQKDNEGTQPLQKVQPQPQVLNNQQDKLREKQASIPDPSPIQQQMQQINVRDYVIKAKQQCSKGDSQQLNEEELQKIQQELQSQIGKEQLSRVIQQIYKQGKNKKQNQIQENESLQNSESQDSIKSNVVVSLPKELIKVFLKHGFGLGYIKECEKYQRCNQIQSLNNEIYRAQMCGIITDLFKEIQNYCQNKNDEIYKIDGRFNEKQMQRILLNFNKDMAQEDQQIFKKHVVNSFKLTNQKSLISSFKEHTISSEQYKQLYESILSYVKQRKNHSSSDVEYSEQLFPRNRRNYINQSDQNIEKSFLTFYLDLKRLKHVKERLKRQYVNYDASFNNDKMKILLVKTIKKMIKTFQIAYNRHFFAKTQVKSQVQNEEDEQPQNKKSSSDKVKLLKDRMIDTNTNLEPLSKSGMIENQKADSLRAIVLPQPSSDCNFAKDLRQTLKAIETEKNKDQSVQNNQNTIILPKSQAIQQQQSNKKQKPINLNLPQLTQNSKVHSQQQLNEQIDAVGSQSLTQTQQNNAPEQQNKPLQKRGSAQPQVPVYYYNAHYKQLIKLNTLNPFREKLIKWYLQYKKNGEIIDNSDQLEEIRMDIDSEVREKQNQERRKHRKAVLQRSQWKMNMKKQKRSKLKKYNGKSVRESDSSNDRSMRSSSSIDDFDKYGDSRKKAKMSKSHRYRNHSDENYTSEQSLGSDQQFDFDKKARRKKRQQDGKFAYKSSKKGMIRGPYKKKKGYLNESRGSEEMGYHQKMKSRNIDDMVKMAVKREKLKDSKKINQLQKSEKNLKQQIAMLQARVNSLMSNRPGMPQQHQYPFNGRPIHHRPQQPFGAPLRTGPMSPYQYRNQFNNQNHSQSSQYNPNLPPVRPTNRGQLPKVSPSSPLPQQNGRLPLQRELAGPKKRQPNGPGSKIPLPNQGKTNQSLGDTDKESASSLSKIKRAGPNTSGNLGQQMASQPRKKMHVDESQNFAQSNDKLSSQSNYQDNRQVSQINTEELRGKILDRMKNRSQAQQSDNSNQSRPALPARISSTPMKAMKRIHPQGAPNQIQYQQSIQPMGQSRQAQQPNGNMPSYPRGPSPGNYPQNLHQPQQRISQQEPIQKLALPLKPNHASSSQHKNLIPIPSKKDIQGPRQPYPESIGGRNSQQQQTITDPSRRQQKF